MPGLLSRVLGVAISIVAGCHPGDDAPPEEDAGPDAPAADLPCSPNLAPVFTEGGLVAANATHVFFSKQPGTLNLTTREVSERFPVPGQVSFLQTSGDSLFLFPSFVGAPPYFLQRYSLATGQLVVTYSYAYPPVNSVAVSGSKFSALPRAGSPTAPVVTRAPRCTPWSPAGTRGRSARCSTSKPTASCSFTGLTCSSAARRAGAAPSSADRSVASEWVSEPAVAKPRRVAARARPLTSPVALVG